MHEPPHGDLGVVGPRLDGGAYDDPPVRLRHYVCVGGEEHALQEVGRGTDGEGLALVRLHGHGEQLQRS